MKKVILLLTAATAVALVSCNPVNPEDEFATKDLTIKATIAATKASAA